MEYKSSHFPNTILMVSPNHFDIKYSINIYMQDKNGQLKQVDHEKAYSQWEEVKNTYKNLGMKVKTLDGVENLNDMVFCANTFFTFYSNGERNVILSNMNNDERKKEVKFFQEFFVSQNYIIHHLPENLIFESMGDLIWDYDRELLFGGHGYRTKKEVYPYIENLLKKEIIKIQLTTNKFYHLDTCLSILNSDTAVVVQEAIDKESYKTLNKYYKNLINVSEKEAGEYFTCNLHCPDGENVLIHPGSTRIVSQLKNLNFKVHEIDTSEFLKSGGSIFCMKNQYFA